MRNAAALPLLLVLQALSAPCATAAEATRLPAFVLHGLGLSPAAGQTGWELPRVEDPLVDMRKLPLAGSFPSSMPRVQLPKVARTSPGGADIADDDEDDEDNPAPLARPGSLSRGFVKLPNPTPQLKPHATLGPHLRPDAEFDLGNGASLGFLGIADGLSPATISSTFSRVVPSAAGARTSPSPNTRPRDIGIGATFEIKLGP